MLLDAVDPLLACLTVRSGSTCFSSPGGFEPIVQAGARRCMYVHGTLLLPPREGELPAYCLLREYGVTQIRPEY